MEELTKTLKDKLSPYGINYVNCRHKSDKYEIYFEYGSNITINDISYNENEKSIILDMSQRISDPICALACIKTFEVPDTCQYIKITCKTN